MTDIAPGGIVVDGYEGHETLTFERGRNGVLIIRINRPEVLNAMTFRMQTGLARVWNDVAADARTNVAVVTGAARGFGSGNDQRQPAADYAQRLRT
jgi:enoyl-CoA hydratase